MSNAITKQQYMNAHAAYTLYQEISETLYNCRVYVSAAIIEHNDKRAIYVCEREYSDVTIAEVAQSNDFKNERHFRFDNRDDFVLYATRLLMSMCD